MRPEAEAVAQPALEASGSSAEGGGEARPAPVLRLAGHRRHRARLLVHHHEADGLQHDPAEDRGERVSDPDGLRRRLPADVRQRDSLQPPRDGVQQGRASAAPGGPAPAAAGESHARPRRHFHEGFNGQGTRLRPDHQDGTSRRGVQRGLRR